VTLRNARDPSIYKQRCTAGTRTSEARRRRCCSRQLHMMAARTAWHACCATFDAVAAGWSRIVRGMHGGYSARPPLLLLCFLPWRCMQRFRRPVFSSHVLCTAQRLVIGAIGYLISNDLALTFISQGTNTASGTSAAGRLACSSPRRVR